MKKLLAIFILACIFLSPALTSSASAHDYDYVYTDVNIITPDSFEDIFSETEADRASFTYEMTVITNSKANVMIDLELKVGSNYYSGLASGQVKSYDLPSGEILWEGPITGEISVGDEFYKITVGFTKLDSSNCSMLTITMKSNNDELVAFSFGDDIIKGEVLTLLNNRTVRQSNSTSTNSLDLNELESVNNEGISTMAIEPGFGPGFSEITHPGTGTGFYENLGVNDEYIYQDSHISYFENTVCPSQELRIYEDESRNSILVTLIPKTTTARSYLSGLGYNYSAAVLDSFSIRVDLKHDAPPSQYAYVMGTYIPGIDDAPTFEKEDEYFPSILSDLLGMIDFPMTSTLTTLISDMKGSISGSRSSFYAQVNVDMSVNPEDMDSVSCGFPVHFNLIKGTDNYVSNTEYTITSYVNYLFIGISTNGEADNPIYLNFYVNDIYTYEGVINLS